MRGEISWYSPLLRQDVIWLRPIGWLNDVLPLRPPSLWRGGAFRDGKWRLQHPELSWLFAAYSMLGVELPAQHISHRAHTSIGVKTGRKQTSLRRAQRRRIRGQQPSARQRTYIGPSWTERPMMRQASSTFVQGVEHTFLKRERAEGDDRPSPPPSSALESSGGQIKPDSAPRFSAPSRKQLPGVPIFSWVTPTRAERSESNSIAKSRTSLPLEELETPVINRDQSATQVRQTANVVRTIDDSQSLSNQQSIQGRRRENPLPAVASGELTTATRPLRFPSLTLPSLKSVAPVLHRYQQLWTEDETAAEYTPDQQRSFDQPTARRSNLRPPALLRTLGREALPVGLFPKRAGISTDQSVKWSARENWSDPDKETTFRALVAEGAEIDTQRRREAGSPQTFELALHRASSNTVGLFNRIHLDVPTMAPLSTTITVLAAVIRSGVSESSVRVPTLGEQSARVKQPGRTLRLSSPQLRKNAPLAQKELQRRAPRLNTELQPSPSGAQPLLEKVASTQMPSLAVGSDGDAPSADSSALEAKTGSDQSLAESTLDILRFLASRTADPTGPRPFSSSPSRVMDQRSALDSNQAKIGRSQKLPPAVRWGDTGGDLWRRVRHSPELSAAQALVADQGGVSVLRLSGAAKNENSVFNGWPAPQITPLSVASMEFAETGFSLTESQTEKDGSVFSPEAGRLASPRAFFQTPAGQILQLSPQLEHLRTVKASDQATMIGVPSLNRQRKQIELTLGQATEISATGAPLPYAQLPPTKASPSAQHPNEQLQFRRPQRAAQLTQLHYQRQSNERVLRSLLRGFKMQLRAVDGNAEQRIAVAKGGARSRAQNLVPVRLEGSQFGKAIAAERIAIWSTQQTRSIAAQSARSLTQIRSLASRSQPVIVKRSPAWQQLDPSELEAQLQRMRITQNVKAPPILRLKQLGLPAQIQSIRAVANSRPPFQALSTQGIAQPAPQNQRTQPILMAIEMPVLRQSDSSDPVARVAEAVADRGPSIPAVTQGQGHQRRPKDKDTAKWPGAQTPSLAFQRKRSVVFLPAEQLDLKNQTSNSQTLSELVVSPEAVEALIEGVLSNQRRPLRWQDISVNRRMLERFRFAPVPLSVNSRQRLIRQISRNISPVNRTERGAVSPIPGLAQSARQTWLRLPPTDEVQSSTRAGAAIPPSVPEEMLRSSSEQSILGVTAKAKATPSSVTNRVSPLTMSRISASRSASLTKEFSTQLAKGIWLALENTNRIVKSPARLGLTSQKFSTKRAQITELNVSGRVTNKAMEEGSPELRSSRSQGVPGAWTAPSFTAPLFSAQMVFRPGARLGEPDPVSTRSTDNRQLSTASTTRSSPVAERRQLKETRVKVSRDRSKPDWIIQRQRRSARDVLERKLLSVLKKSRPEVSVGKKARSVTLPIPPKRVNINSTSAAGLTLLSANISVDAPADAASAVTAAAQFVRTARARAAAQASDQSSSASPLHRHSAKRSFSSRSTVTTPVLAPTAMVELQTSVSDGQLPKKKSGISGQPTRQIQAARRPRLVTEQTLLVRQRKPEQESIGAQEVPTETTFFVDQDGELYRGEEAVRRIKAHREKLSIKSEKPKMTTWNADPVAVEAIEAEVERRIKNQSTPAPLVAPEANRQPEFSLTEIAEIELLAILEELSSSSPEARELLRDILNRVEEHFFFDNFRRIE